MKKFIIIFLVTILWLNQNCYSLSKDILSKNPYLSKNKLDVEAHIVQTIFTEWQDYIKDCNELVADTITQIGVVNCKLVPVHMDGKIVFYNTVPIDTVWDDCECQEYKFVNYITGSFDYVNLFGGLNLTTTGIVYDTIKYLYAEPTKNKFSINRDKVCMIKKRKASFEDFFERWCVEQKLIEMN
jgi:hypothetical protein